MLSLSRNGSVVIIALLVKPNLLVQSLGFPSMKAARAARG